MWTKSVELTESLYQYVLDVNPVIPDELQQFHAETLALPGGHMVIPFQQMHFMQFLLRLIGAKRVLELGTFSGFSALAFALALPDDGVVFTCDVSDQLLSLGRIFWQRLKMQHKIHFLNKPAIDCLESQTALKTQFDFIFIDADKASLKRYVEKASALLSPKGLIAVDNTLFKGEVANPSSERQMVQDIRAFNAYMKTRTDLNVCLLPVADGLTLISRLSPG